MSDTSALKPVYSSLSLSSEDPPPKCLSSSSNNDDGDDGIKPVLMLERAGPNIGRYKKPQATLTRFDDEEAAQAIRDEMRDVIERQAELESLTQSQDMGLSQIQNQILLSSSSSSLFSADIPKQKDYSERWEDAIKEMIIAGVLGDNEEANIRRDKAYEQLMTVCNDFKAAAVAYSKIIILEKKGSEKTIPQCDCGGIAGGVKYRIFDKIFFKFASTGSGGRSMYKTDDSAAKVSGHELKSASHLLSAVMNPNMYKDLIPKGGITPEVEQNIKDQVIIPPLMVLIDYLGYRVIAMPVFPVGRIRKTGVVTMARTCKRCLEEVESCPYCKDVKVGYVKVKECAKCGLPKYKKRCVKCMDMNDREVEEKLRRKNERGYDLSESTLIHGSMNCLESFKDVILLDEPDDKIPLNTYFERICKQLNIKKHKVKRDGKIYETCFPFDLEVHRSTDPFSKSKYFLDLSRLFPPSVPTITTTTTTTTTTNESQSSTPSSNSSSLQQQQQQQPLYLSGYIPTTHSTPPFITTTTTTTTNNNNNNNDLQYLYRLMRPELVKSSPKPISSDWMCFGGHDLDPEGWDDAMSLLNKLSGPGDDILPYAFADDLAQTSIEVHSADLIMRLHTAGVNVRYLGLVYRRLRERSPDSDWCCRVAAEIVARSFRKVVNEELRRLGDGACEARLGGLGDGTFQITTSFMEDCGLSASSCDSWSINENVILHTIIFCLNMLLGSSECMIRKINQDIKERFIFNGVSYNFTIEDILKKPNGKNIERYSYGMPTFMLLTTEFFNLDWYNDVWNSFMNDETFFTRFTKLHYKSLKSVMPRVKEMNIAHHSSGIAMEKFYYNLKKQKVEKIPDYIFNSVTENFRLALLRMPSSSNSLRRYARALSEAQDSAGADEKRKSALKSKLEYIYARLAKDDSAYSLYYAAVYYDKKGDIVAARDLYGRSLELYKAQGNCFLMLADTFGFPDKKELTDTERGKTLYLKGIEEDDIGKRNVFEAGKHLCLALKGALKRPISVTGDNCVSFCKYVLGDEKLSHDVRHFIKYHNNNFKK